MLFRSLFADYANQNKTVHMADVNADGWLDIYICNSGDIKGDNKENELYINQHNNTFIEQAKAYGLNDPGYTTHVSFFDYDLDGYLDCYILITVLWMSGNLILNQCEKYGTL